MSAKMKLNITEIYRLTNKISLVDEPWLEKWARLIRYMQSEKLIRGLLNTRKSINLLDVGCGQDTLFYNYLCQVFPNDVARINYIGLDPLIDKKNIKNKKIKIITSKYETQLKKMTSSFDIITAFAVLEHVDSPKDLLKQLVELLKKDGYLFGTTPSKLAKPVLEFLSYVLGIISKREIDEHKNYFDKQFIERVSPTKNKSGNKIRSCHWYFEFWLNNAFLLKRA